MMRGVIGVVALLGAGAPLHAQNEHLKPLEWIIGKWDGQGKYAPGVPVKARFEYRWTLNKNFIRGRYQIISDGKSTFASETMIGWDVEKKRIVDFGFGMDGSIGWGTDTGSKEKNTWVLEGQLSTRAPFREIRKVLRKVDENTYTETVYAKLKGKYQQVFRMEYKRARKQAAEALRNRAFMVGTWKGEGEFLGLPFRAEYVLRWAHNRTFLAHELRLYQQGQMRHSDSGMLGWDPKKEKFIRISFSKAGAIATGESVPSLKTDTWILQGRSSGPKYKEWRTTIERKSNDEFQLTMETKKGSRYSVFFTILFRRLK